MAEFNPIKRLSPLESSRFILENLRSDIVSFPDRATPKYPLSSYMQTEQQVALMRKFAKEGGCDDELACIGTNVEEINTILYKGWLLRARIMLRQLKRGEGDPGASYDGIMELLENDFISEDSLGKSVDDIVALYRATLQ